MEPNVNAKKKVNHKKLLVQKRDELTEKLVTLQPGSWEFDSTRTAIEDINRILNEKSNALWNGLKIGGMLMLTALGLGLSHWDDIGDVIPGKFVSRFTDGLFNRISK